MDKLKEMATALAAGTMPHLGQPTLPPQTWAQNGDLVTVILADGRKVSANIQTINTLMFKQGIASKPVGAVHEPPVPAKPTVPAKRNTKK
jgi:hypothetical protein